MDDGGWHIACPVTVTGGAGFGSPAVKWEDAMLPPHSKRAQGCDDEIVVPLEAITTLPSCSVALRVAAGGRQLF